VSKKANPPSVSEAQTEFSNGNLKKARQILKRVIEAKPKNVEALNLSGRILMQQGDLDGAAGEFMKSLDLKPDNPACLNALGYILFSQGRAEESEERFRAALAVAPNFIEAVGNLGLVARFLGKHDEALQLLQRAFSGGGATAKILETLANELIFHSQPGPAREILTKLVSTHGDDPIILSMLGKTIGDCGDLGKAESLWDRAQVLDPNCVEPEASRARARQNVGDMDGAITALERALKIDPGHALSLFSWAHVADGNPAATLPRTRVIGMIEDALYSKPIPHDDHARLHFAAGKLFDKEREHSRAIEHYEQANKIVWTLRPVDKEAYTQWHESILSKFHGAFFDRHKDIIQREPSGADRCGEGLIFIVGMPRSGTTLTEQILSRADNLFAGGERPDMDALMGIVQEQTDHDSMGANDAGSLPLSWVRDLAGQHHTQIEKISGPAVHFTDKAPRDFMNLGMIACLFPKAKIVHCVRNPVDTCLSCYFNYFGYNAVRYSYDLETLGHFYSLYLNMMDVWRDILPMPVLDVVYESLVENPEKAIRDMVEFAGLPWSEKFLRPEENQRAVHTASAGQVRKPINKDSVGRWAPYESHLKPLLDYLEKGEGAS
jgi:Flp pilus assembly protein TadD